MADTLLLLDSQIRFACKIARCYEDQNQTDDPAYVQVIELLGTLREKRRLGQQANPAPASCVMPEATYLGCTANGEDPYQNLPHSAFRRAPKA